MSTIPTLMMADEFNFLISNMTGMVEMVRFQGQPTKRESVCAGPSAGSAQGVWRLVEAAWLARNELRELKGYPSSPVLMISETPKRQ